jgi:hypothetical protein
MVAMDQCSLGESTAGARVMRPGHQGRLRGAFLDGIAHRYILGHEELTVPPFPKFSYYFLNSEYI